MELEKFGWNIFTLIVLITALFSILGSYGITHQSRAVWKEETGESLSTTWTICTFYLYLATMVYGMFEFKLALIFNGAIRFIPNVVLLLGLMKYASFKKYDKPVFAVLLLMTIALISFEDKGFIFLLIAIIVIAPTALQPWEIYKRKKIGVVKIKMLMIYAASTLFWVIYAILVNDLFVYSFSLISFIIFYITIVLWYKYQKS